MIPIAERAEDLNRHELKQGVALSAIAHVLTFAAFIFLFKAPFTREFVAAGAGDGTGSGGAIEVGVVAASELGFTKPEPVALIGEKENVENTREVITKKPEPPKEAEVLPKTNKKPEVKAKEKATVTERPTAPRTEQIVKPKPVAGSAESTKVTAGRTYGNPNPSSNSAPSLSGGIGIAAGSAGAAGAGGAGAGGLPGGSEYGRRIQMILSRNYNPPQLEQTNQTQYVIIQLRISRDGQILSLSGGRVPSRYIKQSSSFDLVNRAAERAIIASNPLPPFPGSFLSGVQEAVADIWFRYPK